MRQFSDTENLEIRVAVEILRHAFFKIKHDGIWQEPIELKEKRDKCNELRLVYGQSSRVSQLDAKHDWQELFKNEDFIYLLDSLAICFIELRPEVKEGLNLICDVFPEEMEELAKKGNNHLFVFLKIRKS
jgi:hypothetical protein